MRLRVELSEIFFWYLSSLAPFSIISFHYIPPAFVSAWLPFYTAILISDFASSQSSIIYYFYNKEASGITKLKKQQRHKCHTVISQGREILGIQHLLKKWIYEDWYILKIYILTKLYFWNMLGLYFAESFFNAKYAIMGPTNQSLSLTYITLQCTQIQYLY